MFAVRATPPEIRPLKLQGNPPTSRNSAPLWKKAVATHLVSPASTAGPATTPSATPSPSAATAGAAQVSKVDLQLGRDIVRRLAEVMIHDGVFSVSL